MRSVNNDWKPWWSEPIPRTAIEASSPLTAVICACSCADQLSGSNAVCNVDNNSHSKCIGDGRYPKHPSVAAMIRNGVRSSKPPVIDHEGGVSGYRVADHRVLPEVRHRVTLVPDVVGRELR